MNERHAPAPHIVRQWWEDGHSARSTTPPIAHDFRQMAAVMRLYETTDHKPRKRKTNHRAHFSAATTTEAAAAVPLGCDFVGDFHEEKAKTSDIFPILSDIFLIPSDIFLISSHGIATPEPLFQRAKV